MTHNQNDTFVVTKKTHYSPINSWDFIIQHLDYQKKCTPNSQRMINTGMCSFVADWELPKMK